MQPHNQQRKRKWGMRSFSSSLQRCMSDASLFEWKILHGRLLIAGELADVFLQTEILSAYAKSGDLGSATRIFKSIHQRNDVTWNAILSGFSQHGHYQETIEALRAMHRSAMKLDSYSYASGLVASAALSRLTFGKEIHGSVSKSGWGSSVFVATALLDMYSKCLVFADSRKVFDEMPYRNVVSWNAMLSACCDQEDLQREGLVLFEQMVRNSSLKLDKFTFATVLKLCAGVVSVWQGKQVHSIVIRQRVEDVYVQSSLVEMYSKCGFVDTARKVFEGWKDRRDLVLWTAMVSGYGRHGKSKEVMELFDQMVEEGIKPDEISFVVVMSSCSYHGLVSKGLNYFRSMVIEYGIEPQKEHYACIVDLLTRAGSLEEAWELARELPTRAESPSMWGAFLGACTNSMNLELGQIAAQKLIDLDPQNVGNYVVLSNLYASVEKWKEIAELRQMMNVMGLRKEAAHSWLTMRE